ncbi:MAG TPA: tetratricopeptide repeat protein [Vicinamibacterales bacterium]|nr:tetratricopeptide repeat protein [Vicinamibacterales bacterium]
MPRRTGGVARKSPVAAAPAPVRRRTIVVALALFAVVFTTLQVFRYTRKSATWDEPIHLTAGYVALAHGDFRVDPSHPPFLREWAALPLLLTPHHDVDTGEIDRTPAAEWFNDGYDFARRFLYEANDADALLYRARFMIVLLGLALGGLLFAWAYEWLGFPSAAAALGFYALEPNLTAHSALVTTDFGLTCFMFGAIYFLWRASRRFSAPTVACVALFASLAAVSKFSAVLLAPTVAVLLALAVASRTDITLRRAAALVGVSLAVVVTAIWAVYGFRYLPSPSPTWVLTRAALGDTSSVPWLGAIVGWVDAHHLLPNAYSQGFLFGQASVQNLPAFMAGNVRTGGWWYYFPFALLVKTPVSLLALFAGGIVALAVHRRKLGGIAGAFLLVPIATYLAAAMASGINIGIRHILPIYPFVLLVAVAGTRQVWARRTTLARAAVVVALVFWTGEFARAYPHPLTFFNVFAGGPRNGFHYLADSNVDWGGNLKLLKRWMDRRGVRTINLAYFGSADPRYYDIDATYLPGSPTFLTARIARPRLPGYVAISPTVLDGVYLPAWWRIFYGGFQGRTPAAVVGNTIRIYWVESWPESPARLHTDPDALTVLADGLLDGMHWPEHAAPHYREALTRNPRKADAWNGLGVALTRMGQLREAAGAFQQASALRPRDPVPRRNLAAVLARLNR